MTRKKIKKIALATVGVLALLFIVLVVHIAMVTDRPVPNADLHLSRIDIKENLTLEQQNQLKRQVNALPGVYKTYINPDHNTLVYGYYKEEQSPDAVFASLSAASDFKLEKFEVSEADMAKGCPAFSENSLTFKVGAFVQNVIH